MVSDETDEIYVCKCVLRCLRVREHETYGALVVPCLSQDSVFRGPLYTPIHELSRADVGILSTTVANIHFINAPDAIAVCPRHVYFQVTFCRRRKLEAKGKSEAWNR